MKIRSSFDTQRFCCTTLLILSLLAFIEIQIPIPISVAEYQKGQLYMTARKSLNETTDGGGGGVRVDKNEPYSDEEHGEGQFTLKTILVKEKLPKWLKRIAPKSVNVEETCYNSWPHTITEYFNPLLGKKLTLSIESDHIDNDIGKLENVLNITDETILAKRVVVHINIAEKMFEIDNKKYSADIDPSIFESKDKRGPLNPDTWQEEYLQDENKVIMCAYKLVIFNLKVLGQKKIEEFIMKKLQEIFYTGSQETFCWIDSWLEMTIEDIRKMEDEAAEAMEKALESQKSK